MLLKYQEAIETTNWLMMQTQPKDIEFIPEKTLEELKQLKERLIWLFPH